MSHSNRRLAAIMFTDVVGYSEVTERDEALALDLLEEHRSLLRPHFEQFGGRVIKTMGDGFLIEFTSALAAVQCALIVQQVMQQRNGRCPAERRMEIRIGVHLGDVVVDGEDVLGEGVNVASRIEKYADGGGVCISEDVARLVRTKVQARLESLGTPPLKNISTPIELFRVIGEESAAEHERPSERTSIAVLPFVNMSAESNNEYFSDGLTEDIISQISRISALKVISRTSVMQYKNTSKNLRQIGKELGTATVLEGSVRKVGSQVRVSAQLIDAANDQHIWAQTYDRALHDIFAVQSDVANQIAQALKATIRPREQDQIARVPTESVEAYQLYLQGRYFLSKRTKDGLQKSIAYFKAAMSHDPEYALAYAGLADALIFTSLLEFGPPRDLFPQARVAAERSLALNPALAEAHASLGLVLFQYEWDWAGAEREMQHALSLNPNYAPAHHFYADVLKALGRFEEALSHIMDAQALDPLSLAISAGVGHVLYLSRQYDRAIEAYKHVIELDPNFVQGRLWFGRPYLQKGMFEEAIRELSQAVTLSGGDTISLAVLGHAYAAAGQTGKALEILEQLKQRATSAYVPSYWIGLIHVGLGDAQQALEWLEKAFKERSAWLAWINVEPRFDSLRNEPRFEALLGKIGFLSALPRGYEDRPGDRITK